VVTAVSDARSETVPDRATRVIHPPPDARAAAAHWCSSKFEKIDGRLTIVNNKALHDAEILPWVSARSLEGRVKIDGNADDAPHVTECPWAEDRECDVQQYLELLPYELDLRGLLLRGL
jgi:hypothetical protein